MKWSSFLMALTGFSLSASFSYGSQKILNYEANNRISSQVQKIIENNSNTKDLPQKDHQEASLLLLRQMLSMAHDYLKRTKNSVEDEEVQRARDSVSDFKNRIKKKASDIENQREYLNFLNQSIKRNKFFKTLDIQSIEQLIQSEINQLLNYKNHLDKELELSFSSSRLDLEEKIRFATGHINNLKSEIKIIRSPHYHRDLEIKTEMIEKERENIIRKAHWNYNDIAKDINHFIQSPSSFFSEINCQKIFVVKK